MAQRRSEAQRPAGDRRKRRARPELEAFEPRLLMATLMVTNTGDSGAGSLRQAILDSNGIAGLNSIQFAITTTPTTIQPLTPLPFVTVPVNIDATTQAGFAGSPVVMVDGSQVNGGGDGLGFEVGNSTVRGLIVSNFTREGLAFRAGGGNVVVGDRLTGNGDTGVLLNDAGGDRVGGITSADAVVASGNTNVGVEILAGSNANVVEGSFLGTDPTGTTAASNGLDGIFISGSGGNTIGGEVAGSGNVIGGGQDAAIQAFGASAAGNLVVGNTIGVGIAGTSLNTIGSSRVAGVFLNNAPNNTIGAAVPGGGNLISGLVEGVQLTGAGSSGNVIAGNRIGTNAAGTAAIPNLVGVYVNGAPNNTIGGLTVSARNVISGNTQVGIDLEPGATSGTVVMGNYVGLDASGTTALGNGTDGIFLNSSPNNTIGGSVAGAGNLVAGNPSVGIQIFGATASGNVVSGNTVGLNASGTAIGTGLVGIFLNAAPNNTIGGSVSGAGNTISGGTYASIEQTGTTATGNVVTGNVLENSGQFTIVAENTARNFIPVQGAGANVAASGSVKVFALQKDGPAVLKVVPTVSGSSIVGLVLTFNKPLDTSHAQDILAYLVSAPGRKHVAISSATYDATNLRVTLQFASSLPASTSYRLTVNGIGRHFVADTEGHRLDGKNHGKPGGNFSATGHTG